MWRSLRVLSLNFSRCLTTCKICIVGSNGGVGRYLALNLKLNKYVTDLVLYDLYDTGGLREDLSHIDTATRVTAFSGDGQALIHSLECSDIVVIAAARSDSAKFETRAAMFEANAELMIKFMKATVDACRYEMPFIHLITNPLCAEYLKQAGCYNPRKLIGSTSVDQMRARTFLGQLLNYDPSKIIVPVVGGHSGDSITPLISQSKPTFQISAEDEQRLLKRIINGADEVMKVTKNMGVPSLAIGHCVAKFCNSICRAIYGAKNVVEVGFVPSDINELEFFACNFSVDDEGINKCHRLPPMSPFETELYFKAVKDVQDSFNTAKKYLNKYNTKNPIK